MKLRKRIALTYLAIMASTTGCSHESWTKVEETTRVSSMFNSVLFPVNLVAKVGKAASSPAELSDGDTRRAKQFVLSKRVLADFSADATFMGAILAVQDKFKQQDFGSAVPGKTHVDDHLQAGGSGAVGRYPVGDTFIIVTDEGSEYKVRYEDEVE